MKRKSKVVTPNYELNTIESSNGGNEGQKATRYTENKLENGRSPISNYFIYKNIKISNERQVMAEQRNTFLILKF